MVQKTDLKGVFLVKSGQKFGDERGFFREDLHRSELEEALGYRWIHVQENTAFSKKGVLRGIHVAPWSKLMHVGYGEIMALIFDPRPDSPTFKKHQKFVLSVENGDRLYLEPGLGNAYCVLSEEAVYEYQVSKYYKDCLDKQIIERPILYNDPSLGIEWPITDPIVSDKDLQNPTLDEFLKNGFMEEIQRNI